MSDIMERTLASIPRLLSSSLLGKGSGQEGTGQRQSPPPRNLQALLKAVDNARSRSEEYSVVQKELSLIKEQLKQPGTSPSQWSEIFPRVIFCAVLGYDVSFSHIYALKLAAQGTGRDKRVGYLAATLLLDSTLTITMMMMGTLQRDLQSSSLLDNLMALSASAELIESEYIPLMLPPIVKLLRNRQAIVRERAVYCMHAFFGRAPSLLKHTLPELKSMLGDKDPGVMSAVVTLLASLVEQNAAEFAPLGFDLINILQQVRARKFPSSHEYHGFPLPWLQISLLRMLAHLALTDEHLATKLLPLLSQVLTDANPKEMISLAVVSECLHTIATLAKGTLGRMGGPATTAETDDRNSEEHVRWRTNEGVIVHDAGGGALSSPPTVRQPGGCSNMKAMSEGAGALIQGTLQVNRESPLLAKLHPLLEEASQCVARFLNSGVPNLRCLGIGLLTQLVSVSSGLAAHHQGAVVQCLDDPDPVIRRQTLNLLYYMANPTNVKAVCAKMLEHVHHGKQGSSLSGRLKVQADVVDMVCGIGGRFAPDPGWYLHTLFPLLSLHLDPGRFASITHSMLQFFIRTAQDPAWPDFPKDLFTTMVDAVKFSDPLAVNKQLNNSDAGTSPAVLQFALKVLRFVPLPVEHAASVSSGFLAACSGLLGRERLEVKEGVVLCVQELLLRGCLERQAVLQWVKLTLNKCDQFNPRRYRQKLMELLALSSLESKDLSSLSALDPHRKDLDFSLSFLDTYAAEVCQKQKPLWQARQRTQQSEVSTSTLPLSNPMMPLPTKQSSSTPLSSESGSLPVDTSLYATSSPEENLSQQSLATSHHLPLTVVKRVWTKEGFAGDSDLTKSVSFSKAVANTPESGQEVSHGGSDGAAPDNLDEKEELAKALFQGLSPSTPPYPSLASSPPISATSMADLQKNALAPVSSSPNPRAATFTMRGPESQAVSESHQQPLSTSFELTESSWSAFPGSDPGGWRALHAAQTRASQLMEASGSDQPSSSATQSSGTVTSDRMVSDLGSGSIMSISDDSLENVTDLSYQNSPARKPAVPGAAADQDTLFFHGNTDSGLAEIQDNMHTAYAQDMNGREQSQESARPPTDGENLYSHFSEHAGSLDENVRGDNLYQEESIALGNATQMKEAGNSYTEESVGKLYSDQEETVAGENLYSGFEDLSLYASGWEVEEEEDEEERGIQQRSIQSDSDRLETDQNDSFSNSVLSTVPVPDIKVSHQEQC